MPTATWTLEMEDIVTAGTYTDISSYMQSANWSMGYSAPYEPLARESTLSVVLDNSDQRFSPEYTSGTYYGKLLPGILIRLKSTDPADSTVRTMFIGWVGSIRPTAGLSPDTCEIQAQGWMSRAMTAETSITVMENTTADAVIDKLLETSRVYPPGTSAWFLGVVGQSELDETTKLGDIETIFKSETGVSTFLFAGDNWTDNTTLWGACQDTCGREYGRMWQARDGVLYFNNRHHIIKDVTTDFTFTNTMSDMQYEYGDPADMANVVKVKAQTRRETAAQVLAGLENAVAISGGGGTVDVTFVIESQDSGVSLAVKSPTTPAQTTDFLANTNADGSGTNITSDVTAAIPAATSLATRVTVTYTNANASNGYILAGAQLRGTKLDQFAVVEESQQDDTSIASYGRRELAWEYAMDTTTLASGIAGFIKDERVNPRGIVSSISFKPNTSAALLTAALTHSIFARIAVTETQTGISSAPYFLINETHEVVANDYSVVWGLEPASATTYWILGDASSTFDNSTVPRLGPI